MVAGRGAGMSTGKQAVVALELAEIEELTRQALVRAGASEEHAGAVAHVVMLAEQVQRKLPKDLSCEPGSLETCRRTRVADLIVRLSAVSPPPTPPHGRTRRFRMACSECLDT